MEADGLPYADVNGVRIRYVEKGSGPPLVLLHGLGATHDDWQKQIDFFARVFRVVAPDFRGHGGSEGGGPFTVEQITSDVSQLLDALKIGSLFVVGHSMGGAVAMQLALYKPDRVKKLVLSNTLPSFVPDTFEKRLMLWTRAIMMRFLGPEALAKRMALKMFPHPEQEPLRELLVERQRRTPKAVYLALLRTLSRWSVADRLSWFTMPAFVLAGEQDYFPPDAAQNFADRLPNGICRIVEGGTHHLPLGKPEEFNRLVMDFLMPGSHIAATKGDASLNWLRIDTAAQKKIDLGSLMRR